jgi:hypothetical protein
VEYIFVCLDSEKPKKTSEAVESQRIKKEGREVAPGGIRRGQSGPSRGEI